MPSIKNQKQGSLVENLPDRLWLKGRLTNISRLCPDLLVHRTISDARNFST